MIPFHRPKPEEKDAYESILFACPPRGCGYSFANLYLWGQQQIAFHEGCVAFFSCVNGHRVYPYPIGTGDRRSLLEAIQSDARERGIPCRLTSLTQADCRELEDWFPGKFVIHPHRDSFDYVYAIGDLADLPGRKFQKKRNHVNRFAEGHPHCRVLPLTLETLAPAQELAEQWFLRRHQTDPQGDYLPESVAVSRTFRNFAALGLEGIALEDDGQILAVSIGSALSRDTFDIHFEKAREDVDGAYSAVNRAFAQYLRRKYPDLRYLNREDDLGLEGLRRAKLSYHPHHLEEKYLCCRKEDLLENRFSHGI